MDQNPFSRSQQIEIFKAIVNSDNEYIHQWIVNADLANVHLDLSQLSDVPSVLKFNPPIISIAAYYGNKAVFDFLFMSNASISEVDKIFFLFYHV